MPFYVVWNYQTAPELKWLLGQARFGIGLSYHFHVFLLDQGIPSIALYTNSYYDVKLRGAYAAFGYTSAPLPYSYSLCTESEFQVAIETATGWADADRKRLRLAAAEMRSQWHEAFKAFLHDNRIEQ